MKVCPVRTVRTSAGGGGLDRAVRVFEAEPSVDPGRRQQRLEVLLPEHDADLGALAHAAREPPDGGAVPRQIAQRLAHDAGGDTVLAHHLGDARAEERRGDRDHTAGHDALGVGERDPEHHAAHGVTNAVHHRRLASIQPGELPAQLLEFAPEALDLLLERQPRTRAAEVVNLEPGRSETARHGMRLKRLRTMPWSRITGCGRGRPSGCATGAKRSSGMAASDAGRPPRI